MIIKCSDLTKKPLTTFYREVYEAASRLMGEPDFVEKGKREIYIYRDMRIIRKVSGRCRVDLYVTKGTIPLVNKFLLQLTLNHLTEEYEISKRVSKPERKAKGSR